MKAKKLTSVVLFVIQCLYFQYLLNKFIQLNFKIIRILVNNIQVFGFFSVSVIKAFFISSFHGALLHKAARFHNIVNYIIAFLLIVNLAIDDDNIVLFGKQHKRIASELSTSKIMLLTWYMTKALPILASRLETML